MDDRAGADGGQRPGWALIGCLVVLMLASFIGPLLFPFVLPILLAVTPRPQSARELPWWLVRATVYALAPFTAVFFWAEEVGKREGKDAQQVLVERFAGKPPAAEEEQG